MINNKMINNKLEHRNLLALFNSADNYSDSNSNSYQVSQDQTTVYQLIFENLQAILNTRRANINKLNQYKFAKQSILSYGLVDFNKFDYASINYHQSLCQIIQSVIEQYEPRLKNINITLLNSDQMIDRCLKIRIEGRLNHSNKNASFELEVK